MIFIKKSTFFFYVNFQIELVLKISTFLQLFAKKCKKPKNGLNGKKIEKQISTFLHLFGKKCVKSRICLIFQKLEKQMGISDLYAKIA